jgi:hypothetical protein
MRTCTAMMKTSLLIAPGLCILVIAAGCNSVPPQVAKTHQKELEILQSLEKSHLAMVNSFIDQKIQNFENMFFNKYGPVFLENWVNNFQTLYGRPYDPVKDFPVLYNDLVAEYQAESSPIEELRVQLRDAIATEYRNAISAHKSIGGWLDSLEKLNAAQRQTIDGLLGAIQPGLSLDSVEEKIKDVEENVKTRISELQQTSN